MKTNHTWRIRQMEAIIKSLPGNCFHLELSTTERNRLKKIESLLNILLFFTPTWILECDKTHCFITKSGSNGFNAVFTHLSSQFHDLSLGFFTANEIQEDTEDEKIAFIEKALMTVYHITVKTKHTYQPHQPSLGILNSSSDPALRSYLTGVVQDNCIESVHEDLWGVFIHRTLTVPNVWHILDDHTVIWLLTLLIQNVVGFHHVIHHIALGDLQSAHK